jgi:subfamily B ATP-binding cassette protein MsbA
MAMQQNWQQAMSTIGSIEMVENEFRVTNENKEKDGAIILDTKFEGILFNHLSFSYNNQQKILNNLEIEIKANTTIAFAGESGAGKTTLVDLLTLLLKPTEGELLVNGISSDQIQLSSWRSQIGYVSQDTVVFDDTIANNICLWNGEYKNDPDIRKKVEEAAKKAHADGFINQMPNGYETMVGERGVRVSGGQKQRLFIARELYKNPSLLILDEATSALDSESERYIQESIDNLKGALTVVIIAHRLSTIRNADIIYVMDKGRIIESGSFEELAAKEHSRFSKMVNIQQI